MNAHDDENRESEPVDQEPDTGIAGGGGPASVIYADNGDAEADEIAEEMLKAPDEER